MADWSPSASLENLKNRADALARTRHFFAARDVMEVDVPVLARATVTDPNIESFCVTSPVSASEKYYLMTSPEFFMKRLLVAGSGPIYYLGGAFRADEKGARHNPAFTMLEWYRPQWLLKQLMCEVIDLVRNFLPGEVRYSTYRQLFLEHAGIDPHRASLDQLKTLAHERLSPAFDSEERSVWLDLLFSHVVEPQLSGLVFVEQFPAAQASLAQTFLDDHGNAVAARFELYADGIELANGYQEELNADVLQKRFDENRALRSARGQIVPCADEKFLAAMRAGMPACAGVALGFDRLLMLSVRANCISDVMSFQE